MRFVLTFALCVGLAACSLLRADEIERQGGFDSVFAPDSAVAGAAFTFDVVVTTGECAEFDRIETVRTQDSIELTVYGLNPGGECPYAIIRYTERTLRVDPPFEGPFRIVGRQPDGTTIERVVRVVAAP